MFGFEKLEVYNLTHSQYIRINAIISTIKTDALNADVVSALKIANLEMLQFFVKGSFHIDSSEKKKHYTDSRGAVFQSVALIKVLRDILPTLISDEQYAEVYSGFESLSRMMLTLIKNHSLPGGRPSSIISNRENGQRKSSFNLEDGSAVISDDGDDFMNFNKLEIGE